MSSVKVKNKTSGQWDIISSIEARAMRITNSHYKATTIDGVLTEIATILTAHKNCLAWIYKNGTIGGGGGGGGGTGATGKIVTSITTDPYFMSTTESLVLNYRVDSRFGTNFNVTLKVDQQTPITRSIKPNTWETWTVGRLAKGNHTLFITGTDVDLIPLEPITINVIAGALELTSTFNDSVIFNVASDIKIPFTASSYLTTPLNLESKINSSVQPTMTDIQKDRLLEYNIGKRGVGVYNVELQATSGGFLSNKLEYTINVASTDQLFLSVASNIKTQFARGVPIKFAYTIAVLGYTAFITKYKINGKTGQMNSRLGTNVFEIPSDDFGAGTYTLELTASDADGVIHTAEPLLIPITITASDFTPFPPNQSGLIAWFQARGIDAGETSTWKNLVTGSPITCTLQGINGVSNGFIGKGNINAIDKSLVLNGEAYAQINYKPFSKDKLILTNGFTLSVLYKTSNIGNKKARVIDFGEYNPNTDSLIAGCYVDTEDAEISTIRKSLNAKISDSEWINQTFVVDQNFLRVYNNGVVTAVVKHDGFGIDDTTNGAGDEKASFVNLGMRQVQRLVGGVDTTVRTDFADCDIKDVKIYSRALTSEQVVYNYVGDEFYLHTKTVNGNLEFDEDKQKALRRLNSMNENGEFVLDTTATSPFPTLFVDFTDETTRQQFREYSERTVWAENDNPFREFRCVIDYADHANKRYLTKHPAIITLQGTSSIGYTSKNYELYLGKMADGQTDYIFAPKTGWLPENQFTLKCNMMDSSHANNVGTGRLINNGKQESFTGENGWFRDVIPPKGDQNNQNRTHVRDAIDGFPFLMEAAMGRKDAQDNDDNYLGVYTFNMGRGSLYNMGLKNIKYTEVGGVVTEYTEDFTGYYAPDVCFCYEISTSHNQGAGAFKQQSDAWIRRDFKKIYPTVDTTTGFNQLKAAVLNTSRCGDPVPVLNPVTDEVVKDEQGNIVYTDSWATQFTEISNWNLPSIADYFILAMVLGMVDNLGKNMMMKTWFTVGNQKESQWYASFYDMDTILGLDNVGLIKHSPSLDVDRYPTGNFVEDQKPANGNIGRGEYNLSDSRLWNLYRQYYSGFESRPENEANSFLLRQRYTNMRRSGIITYDNIISKYMSVINEIGQNYYNKDADIKYMNSFANVDGEMGYHNLSFLHGTREHYTKLWVKRRITYLDSLFDASSNLMEGNTAAKGLKFRFNPNPTGTSNRVMKVISRSPVFITVLWSGEDNRQDFSKLLVNQNGQTTFQKTFDAGTQSTNMNFGPEVMYMDQLNIGNPSYLDLSNASSLIELDLSGNTFLQAINLQYCTSLRKLYLQNCSKLGEGASEDPRKYIDVTACINLQELDISNTKLAQVSLPSGGTLKTLRCNDTLIGKLDLSNQSFLENVDLSNCTNLSEVILVNCKMLKRLILPNTAIVNFLASNCPNLEEVNLSNSKYLRSINFNLTPNMKKLNMAYCNNSALTDVNLVGCPILEDLELTACTATLLRFPDTISTMKRLVCNQSALQRTQFGTRPEDVYNAKPAVNLQQLSGLTSVSFNNCPNLQYVINTNLNLTNPASTFAACTKLHMVTGTIKITGSMTSMFNGCSSFQLLGDTTANPVLPSDTGNFPLNMDLTGVTSMSSTFFACTKLSMPDLYYILRRTPNLVSANSCFLGCSAILATTARPMSDKLFEKLTKFVDGTFMFNGCSGMGGPFPEKALSTMIALRTCYRMFLGCKFTTFNQATFITNTKLVDIRQMFEANSLSNTVYAKYLFVKAIDLVNADSLFEGNTNFSIILEDDKVFALNPKLESITNIFAGTRASGRVEPNIFGGITPTLTTQDESGQTITYRWPVNLVNVQGAFYNTNVSGTFSDKLFANLSKLQYAGRCFATTQMSGDIPVNLFANNPELLSVEGFFLSLVNVVNQIPADLFKNNPKLSNVSNLFNGCTGLASAIPATLFKNNPKLQFISGLFANANKLAGSIPEDLFKVTEVVNGVPMNVPLAVVEADRLFYGCYGLSGSIPGGLFRYMPNIKTLNSCFYDCGTVARNVDTGLEGAIPENLLWGLFDLTDVSGLFYRCNKIRQTVIRPENPLEPDILHMIPAAFFRDNANITTASSTFEYLTGASSGELPLGLFDPLINLTNANRMFYNSMIGNRSINRDMFRRNNRLNQISFMFSNESVSGSANWTGTLDPDLFRKYTSGVTGIAGNPLRNVQECFSKNTALKGFAVKFWLFDSVLTTTRAYFNCTSLTDYADIPPIYKGTA